LALVVDGIVVPWIFCRARRDIVCRDAVRAGAAASKSFRRIMGHQHLWMLKAALDESQADHKLAQEIKAG